MFKGVSFLISFCWKFSKKFIIFQLIASILAAINPLISIILPKYIIDELINKQRIDILIILCILLVVSTFIGNIFIEWLKTKAFINKNIAFQKMQIYITENLFDADYENLEKAEFLDLKEKAKKFLYGDGRGFATIFEDFSNSITSILKFLGIIIIIANLNIIIVILLIILVSISAYFDSYFSKLIYNIDMDKIPIERQVEYYMKLTDDFQYGKEIRIYQLKSWIIRKYREVLNECHKFYKVSYEKTFLNSFLKHLSTLIEQGLMYIYLVYSVINNNIGIGDFAMYISAISLFSESMKILLNNIVVIKKYNNYYKELELFLNMPKINNCGSEKLNNKKQITIEFKNVFFKYNDRDRYVLNNICFKITSNEKVAIVGENGAGKTTLVKLLLRLYQPTEGCILMNGIDINKIDYEEYINLFSTVFQDYKLFATSIKENIAFDDNVSDYSINECLYKSGFTKDKEYLSKNENKQVYKIFDSDGIEFSGGQAQKIALSRAIYKNSKIIILDEPTAALDPRAEFTLYEGFNSISKGKIVIYITHRLCSTRFADNIVVLKSGFIEEYGTHVKLLNNKGLYAELYNMQLSSFK